MLRALLLALLLVVVPAAARADAVSETDRSEFRRIISEQIAAFRADDGPRAYSYAAPIIRQIFPTPESFMQMVRNGYRPVYRPQQFAFRAAESDAAGRPVQRVEIIGPDGRRYEAVYSMERQPDGSWRISGCSLIEMPGLDA